MPNIIRPMLIDISGLMLTNEKYSKSKMHKRNNPSNRGKNNWTLIEPFPILSLVFMSMIILKYYPNLKFRLKFINLDIKGKVFKTTTLVLALLLFHISLDLSLKQRCGWILLLQSTNCTNLAKLIKKKKIIIMRCNYIAECDYLLQSYWF